MLTGVAGFGRCGLTAYCELDGVPAVVKIIDCAKKRLLFDREVSAYRALSSLQGVLIPRLLAIAEGSTGRVRGLVLERGIPLAESTDRAALADALKRLARYGWHQTDPREENFVRDPRDPSKLWVIDLESLERIDRSKTHESASPYSATPGV